MFEFEIHMIGCLQKTQGDPPKIQIDTFGLFFIHSENIVVTRWQSNSAKVSKNKNPATYLTLTKNYL